MSKSRVYGIDDDDGGSSRVSFEFDANQNLLGITKDGNPVNPTSAEFTTLSDSDESVAAFNVNKYGTNLDACLLYTSPRPRDSRAARVAGGGWKKK